MWKGHYHLGKLALADGDQTKAQDYLRRSGYKDFDRPVTLTTPFSEEAATGHTFAPRRISEVVPGRVYALSGFEFTEYCFVVSDDRRELIGIDAGARPDSAKASYEALQAYAPGLPELPTIFITHSHWDHIGGHTYFRSLNPRFKFYARSNYEEEIARDNAGDISQNHHATSSELAPRLFANDWPSGNYLATRGGHMDALFDCSPERDWPAY